MPNDPPFIGLTEHPQISWSIPGLREDPTLCLRCRAAQMLCGKPVCPILLRHDALLRTLPAIPGREFQGSSPPALFVGRFGYPKVSVGPLLSPNHGDTLLLDSPEEWVGRSVAEVVGFRMGLIRGMQTIRVTDAESPGRIAEQLQLLALASGSAEAEATFRRPPRGRITLSDGSPPAGPSAPLEQIHLEVRRVDARLDRLHGDIHANARTAVRELYAHDVPVSRIQRALSAGTLGRRGSRRFVPTRWSITAVDDMLGKENLERVRRLPELGEIRIQELVALGNRWMLVRLPGTYRYESIEAWYPETFWNPHPTNIVLMGDHEGHWGRRTYASIGGCYYAARLAFSEAMLRDGRQGGALLLREVHPGEILPLGVWNVREHVRAALRTPFRTVAGLDELIAEIGRFLAIPSDRWIGASSLLRESRGQRRLEEFLAPGSVPAVPRPIPTGPALVPMPAAEPEPAGP
ncbi:MAG: Nre family DNA repair protein [Thermoplasmata archaeon]